jgi:ankyrin repeat protein
MARMALVPFIALLLCGATLPAGTKLSRAAVDGDLVKVQELVKGGEQVNEEARWGWTPLLWAAYYGQPQVVDFLLAQGADPNRLTKLNYGNFKPGTSALILAAYYGHAGIVKALLEAKADPAIKDNKGMTALTYAKEFDFGPCVELLQPKQPD